MPAVDEETGEEVPRNELVRRYEFDKDWYVIIGAEEVDALKIECRTSSISNGSSIRARSSR